MKPPRPELVEQARLERDVAAADLMLAQKSYDRVKDAGKQVSPNEFDMAWTSLKTAKGKFDAAKVKLDMVLEGGWTPEVREAEAEAARASPLAASRSLAGERDAASGENLLSTIRRDAVYGVCKEVSVRRWAVLFALACTGCSTAPLAGFLDLVAPAKVRIEPVPEVPPADPFLVPPVTIPPPSSSNSVPTPEFSPPR